MNHAIKCTVSENEYIFLLDLKKKARINPTQFVNSVVSQAIAKARSNESVLNAMFPQLSFLDNETKRKVKK